MYWVKIFHHIDKYLQKKKGKNLPMKVWGNKTRGAEGPILEFRRGVFREKDGLEVFFLGDYYLLKVNNRNTTKRCEI